MKYHFKRSVLVHISRVTVVLQMILILGAEFVEIGRVHISVEAIAPDIDEKWQV